MVGVFWCCVLVGCSCSAGKLLDYVSAHECGWGAAVRAWQQQPQKMTVMLCRRGWGTSSAVRRLHQIHAC